MLKTRIIPTLLFKNHSLVKGKNFDSSRVVGSVLESVKLYEVREVDELIFLDINATKNRCDPEYDYIETISKDCFVPLCVGGGIKNLKQIYKIFKSGADKVSINSEAFLNPHFILEASKEFGSQCIVISIDYKKKDEQNLVYINSGKTKTNTSVIEFSKQMQDMGSGEILLTSIDKDGTMLGYDYSTLKEVKENLNIPIIASGGAGSYEDMFKAISYSKVDAVAASSIFYFRNMTPKEAKLYLVEKGINVRI